MLRGLYTGAMGMMVQQTAQDVTANNLANVDTPGYKRDITVFKSFPQILMHRMNDNVVVTKKGTIDYRPTVGWCGTGVEVNEVFTEHRKGPIKKTGDSFDFAIHGEGFFCVQGIDGKERYTRNGAFTINKDGFLVTREGELVLGEKGPIQVSKWDFVVWKDGTIVENPVNEPKGWKNAAEVAKFKIVDFNESRFLDKVGYNRFETTPESGEAFDITEGFEIKQGHLEMSNVNIVEEMVRMIGVMRAYEANQKVITSHDEILGRAVNDVPRVVGG